MEAPATTLASWLLSAALMYALMLALFWYGAARLGRWFEQSARLCTSERLARRHTRLGFCEVRQHFEGRRRGVRSGVGVTATLRFPHAATERVAPPPPEPLGRTDLIEALRPGAPCTDAGRWLLAYVPVEATSLFDHPAARLDVRRTSISYARRPAVLSPSDGERVADHLEAFARRTIDHTDVVDALCDHTHSHPEALWRAASLRTLASNSPDDPRAWAAFDVASGDESSMVQWAARLLDPRDARPAEIRIEHASGEDAAWYGVAALEAQLDPRARRRLRRSETSGVRGGLSLITDTRRGRLGAPKAHGRLSPLAEFTVG